jgi:hypothetical protein
MSRTITTLVGQEVSGLKSSFYEEGDFIVKKEPFGGRTRIRKDLVVKDSECSTALEIAVGVAAIGAAVAVALLDEE